MIWQVQLDPAMCAASVHARLPLRLGRRTPLSNPQHRLHPAKQRKVMGLLESLAEATAIMSGELRDTEPTPVHFLARQKKSWVESGSGSFPSEWYNASSRARKVRKP